MKCEKCELDKPTKPWTVKTLGLAGTFTWNLCQDCTPKDVPDKPFTSQQIEGMLRGE